MLGKTLKHRMPTYFLRDQLLRGNIGVDQFYSFRYHDAWVGLVFEEVPVERRFIL